MDVDRYLARIGVNQRPTATAASLTVLMGQHLLTVPFENIDIHTGTAIELDVDHLFDKIVDARRGGFCYELNGLFAVLLESLGFPVVRMSCRVFGEDGTACRPFNHLALAVTTDGVTYLVDVGFGEGLRQPLELAAGRQENELGYHRTVEETGDEFRLVQLGPNGQTDGYFIDPTPRSLSEFAEMCEFHQRSDESLFTRKLLCTLATPHGRKTLADYSLITTHDGRRHVRALGTADHRRHIIRDEFGIVLHRAP